MECDRARQRCLLVAIGRGFLTAQATQKAPLQQGRLLFVLLSTQNIDFHSQPQVKFRFASANPINPPSGHSGFVLIARSSGEFGPVPYGALNLPLIKTRYNRHVPKS